jgi:uncharacterized protein (DUF885 family)
MTDVVAFADEYWRFYRDSSQLWNIDRGDVEQIEHWEDLSPTGVATRVERLASFADRADSLSSVGLDERDRGLLAAIEFSARATTALLPYERDLSLVAGPFNFAAFVEVLVPGYALVTREHGRGYIDKLRSMPAFIDGWIAGLRDSAASGRVATARGILATTTALDRLLSTDVDDNPLATQEPPSEASDAEVAAWRGAVRDAIREACTPALAVLRTMLHDELLPIGRSDDKAGVCHLPGGADGYAGLLWASTSTGLTPDAVHQIGLQQLALLDDQYRQLGEAAVGVADPSELRERLRINPGLRYATSDEIVADAMASLARAEAEVTNWFERLPRARCNAVAVASGPLAFYTGPSPDGNRGGTFFYNTANPAAWTRFQLEVTTFHEAVPGHHLQLALAADADLHPVVGQLEVTSYSEGWGLYAERLADEMGLYSSPLQRIGMLTLDSLRAARLVVDTGIHALGWTRQDAIDFMLAHTASSPDNAEGEVDRYIAQPGQATSYMIGRLEIQRIRDEARQRLGSRFSIKDFHAVVLGNGMTPLEQLARNVDSWVENQLSA